jgi:hypothetical protein
LSNLAAVLLWQATSCSRQLVIPKPHQIPLPNRMGPGPRPRPTILSAHPSSASIRMHQNI